MDSKTVKIGKGYGFILRPAVLDQSLQAAGLSIDTYLVRGPGKRLFDAHFWPPNPNVGYERLYVSVGAVRIARLPELRAEAEGPALTRLTEWISGIIALDAASPIRREPQSITLISHLGC